MRNGNDLNRYVWRCGALIAVSLGIMVPLSFGIAPFSPREHRQPEEVVLFHRLGKALPLTADAHLALDHWFEGRSVLQHRDVRAAAYTLPLLAASIAFALALRALLASPATITGETTNLLFRLSVAMALISILAYPIFTGDFWLSIVWGRMIAIGQNPWYQSFPAESLRGLPVRDWGDRMTYGPLWGWMVGGITWIAGNSVGAVFLLGKGLLAGAWILTLALIRRIGREQFSEADAAIAVCLFGWIPMSAGYSVREGHNDIVMVAALTLWLYLVSRRKHLLSPVALTVSVLIKYVTAPLILFEALLAWRNRVRAGPYLAVGLGCVAGVILIFLPFFRGMDMFEPARKMQAWVFWTPATFITDLARYAGVGLPITRVTYFVTAALLGILLWSAWRWWRDNSFPSLLTVVLSVLTLSLFVVVGHVWPWFAVWLLPAAALTWHTHLGRAALVFCFLIPVLNQGWYLADDWSLRTPLGVLLYGGTAVLFALLTWWGPARIRTRPDSSESSAISAGIAA